MNNFTTDYTDLTLSAEIRDIYGGISKNKDRIDFRYFQIEI